MDACSGSLSTTSGQSLYVHHIFSLRFDSCSISGSKSVVDLASRLTVTTERCALALCLFLLCMVWRLVFCLLTLWEVLSLFWDRGLDRQWVDSPAPGFLWVALLSQSKTQLRRWIVSSYSVLSHRCSFMNSFLVTYLALGTCLGRLELMIFCLVFRNLPWILCAPPATPRHLDTTFTQHQLLPKNSAVKR